MSIQNRTSLFCSFKSLDKPTSLWQQPSHVLQDLSPKSLNDNPANFYICLGNSKRPKSHTSARNQLLTNPISLIFSKRTIQFLHEFNSFNHSLNDSKPSL